MRNTDAGNSKSPELQWIISAGREKAEALDARIMDALLELKNDQMREVARKQIQVLALLG